MMPKFTTSWRQSGLGTETFTAMTARPSQCWMRSTGRVILLDVVWMNGSLLGMLGMQETLTRPEVSKGWSIGAQSTPGNKPSN